jgi:hypothetical protein
MLNDHTQRLRREGLNLIILKGDKTLFTSREEGMRPLFEAIDSLGLSTLEDSIVADKIVGKAAALLVSYFKAREVHCIVLSERAREVLDKRRIRHYPERLTPEIMNRLGTDICPFERAVLDVEDPEKGYERVYTKLRSLGLVGNVETF